MKVRIDRVILIVLDGLGIGALPDAGEYGDEGSNTLANIAKVCGGLEIPNMVSLGLGKVAGVDCLKSCDSVVGCYGRMSEASKGKDTITGHWEIAGIRLEKAFPVYPNGFPQEIIGEFEKRIGTKVLGNYAASGTEIIKELGETHIKTGFPIVYTSADSVFQIAAHEDVIPVDRLYEICQTARGILSGEHNVGRVVARPFKGVPGNFERTRNRKDFSIEPVKETVLDKLAEKGWETVGIGKIEDIFNGRGITRSVHTSGNKHGIDMTLELMKQRIRGLIFTNLVDFDMLYGHRNDPKGFKEALEEFDRRIPEIMSAMEDEDVLIITADHGCDPVTPSTDHSREYVPLLVYGKNIKKGVNLTTRESFSDIACTISEIFELGNDFPGVSFLDLLTDASIDRKSIDR